MKMRQLRHKKVTAFFICTQFARKSGHKNHEYIPIKKSKSFFKSQKFTVFQ